MRHPKQFTSLLCMGRWMLCHICWLFEHCLLTYMRFQYFLAPPPAPPPPSPPSLLLACWALCFQCPVAHLGYGWRRAAFPVHGQDQPAQQNPANCNPHLWHSGRWDTNTHVFGRAVMVSESSFFMLRSSKCGLTVLGFVFCFLVVVGRGRLREPWQK